MPPAQRQGEPGTGQKGPRTFRNDLEKSLSTRGIYSSAPKTFYLLLNLSESCLLTYKTGKQYHLLHPQGCVENSVSPLHVKVYKVTNEKFSVTLRSSYCCCGSILPSLSWPSMVAKAHKKEWVLSLLFSLKLNHFERLGMTQRGFSTCSSLGLSVSGHLSPSLSSHSLLSFLQQTTMSALPLCQGLC